MARGQPPEVEPEEYERRLFAVFAEGIRKEGLGGYITEDVWLEGEHPHTKIVIAITFRDRSGCRYIFRSAIWRSSSDSNPESQAYDIDIGLQEWSGTLRSIPWAPGMTYDPHPASAGCAPRRPSVGG